MKIIIDSGHGGTDFGAVAFGMKEKDLNLIFSQKLAAKLESLGYEVDKSLITDEHLDSVNLTNRIKSSGARLCLSCHNNAFNGQARGFEIIHSIHSNGKLSQSILNNVQKTGFPVRKSYSRESSTYSGMDYYFLIRLTYPEVETIIIEFGFMDNEEDFKLLNNTQWQDKLTAAVADAVKQHMPVTPPVKTPIAGEALLTPYQLKNALTANNLGADTKIADIYYNISHIYKIKPDLAFLQAMLETNWLKFTGIVRPEQNNFAGLGATGSSNPGEWFATVEAGVEAHIQHLFAYCSSSPIPQGRKLYDTRFHLVQRGSAPNWEDLNGRWAVPGIGYGETIIKMQRAVAEKYPADAPSTGVPEDNPQENHWAKPCNDELMLAGLLYSDHSLTLDASASKGMLFCLVNRLRKLLINNQVPGNSDTSTPHPIHWAKPCNDELMEAGLLLNDHSQTLDDPASEGMVICLVNRLRKEFMKDA